MSNHQSEREPLDIISEKNYPQPQQLLLPRQPQDQLIDFGEIGGFFKQKNDQIANPYGFDMNQIDLDQRINNFNKKQENYPLQNQQHQQSIPSHQNHSQNNNHHTDQQNNHQKNCSPQLVEQQKIKLKRKCICKKTKCLKMYCQCFASNLPCTQQCTCMSCKNTIQHQKQIIQAKLMIQQKGIVGLHSCSLSEKRCNCKKSNCLKKYCQCYNSGVKCSQACKCQACKNCDNPHNDEGDKQIQNEVKNVKVKKQKKKGKKQVKN